MWQRSPIGTVIRDPANQTTALPGEWWTDARVCVGFCDLVRKHILGLGIEYVTDSKLALANYTGIMLTHRDRDMWVTAGHVIDQICELRDHRDVAVRRVRIVDHCETPNAEALPFDLAATQFYSAMPSGLDFGAMWLPPITTAGILGSGSVEPLTEQIWKGRQDAFPDGYYLVGYPEESLRVSRTPIGGGLARYERTSTLVCLPIRAIVHGVHADDAEFWNDPEAFYGEILPYTGEQIDQPTDIRGMSGGPLFAFVREPEGVRYFLWGLQRSWDRRNRFVRCEPIDRIVDAMRPRVSRNHS